MNYDNMSFAQAFAAAHDAGDDVFTWKGKQFKTTRKDGKQTNARKQAQEARSAAQRPAQVSHTFNPAQHRQMEAGAPLPPPYPHYDRDGPILRAVKEKLMAAHNAARSPFGMQQLFPNAKPGQQTWKEAADMINGPLAYRDMLAGRQSPDYGSMPFGDKFLQYLMGTAGKTAEVGMGMTGMYQGGRAMELNNALRAMAQQPRQEPFIGAAQRAQFLPYAPD